ncbi:helix-turn-helix transcriptional regulator [Catenuloplanes japonicus]|uniref:helix-turn-helix transcriptional regulator n=1 Tax=Catenuloplanes japonicus TaxID=33876 RepID=UPI000ABD1299|nr:helix-turn-helix transcriptional regulator [Catenuloplanes japonicus]
MDDVGLLSVDTRATGRFGEIASAWRQRIGDRFAMPALDPATRSRFHARMDAVRLHDIIFNTIDLASGLRTTGFATRRDLVRVWIVRRGAWAHGDARGDEHRVAAGRLLVCGGPMAHFAAEPGTRTDLLVLPATALGPRWRTASGTVSQAEVRVLIAHAATVRESAGDLRPAGRLAARDTLVELVRAVTAGGVDPVEPLFAPPLARAARDLADRILTHPGLSAALLARSLNVSVRTLQRAFAAEGESVAGWLRGRRLDAARDALTGGDLTISEAAARWQFADASHFTRLFRHRYGATPREFVRRAPGS